MSVSLGERCIDRSKPKKSSFSPHWESKRIRMILDWKFTLNLDIIDKEACWQFLRPVARGFWSKLSEDRAG